jgi:hypothetical protein
MYESLKARMIYIAVIYCKWYISLLLLEHYARPLDVGAVNHCVARKMITRDQQIWK